MPPPEPSATGSPDPRDLTGPFRHELEIEVRFADTDGMRHVNNAKYLTYCEIARIRYWTDVTGETFGLHTEGVESLILAEARITYRAQAFYGMAVTPKLADGRVPLQLALLSPAGRPVAITADLAGFWRGGWADVRRDMRGRYPKHAWPEDPSVRQ